MLFAPGTPVPWAPMPIYLVLLALGIGYGAVGIFPIIHVFSWWLISKQVNISGLLQFLGIGVLFALDAFYLYSAQYYGNTYQGRAHTNIVTIVNIGAFLILLPLSLFSWKRGSYQLTRLTNFCLLFFLSYYAFPYLGELP